MVVIQQSTVFPEADIALADVTGCIGSVETIRPPGYAGR